MKDIEEGLVAGEMGMVVDSKVWEEVAVANALHKAVEMVVVLYKAVEVVVVVNGLGEEEN